MPIDGELPGGMTVYERAEWHHLQQHWGKKARHKELLPPAARRALETTGHRSRAVISQAGEKIGDYTPEPVKRASGHVVDAALVPTVKAAIHLLELAEEWAAEAMNPDSVLAHHRSNGHAVHHLDDLRGLDLEHLDRFTRRMALRWRSVGALEGGAMGALSCVPVAGTAASITADLVVTQMLSTAVACQSMYSYGYDAQHAEQRLMVDKIVRRAYRAHAPKAKVLRDSSKAFQASRNRVRWSAKLREDHKLIAAVERLMQQFGDGKVGVRDVSKKLPYIAVVTNAGANAYVLGDIAKQGVLYSRTRLLADKYDLPLPPNLMQLADSDDGAVDGDMGT